MGLNTLTLAHRFLEEQVRPGALCIDATAGKGRDTALLCSLVGESGRVLAFDIQPQAIAETSALLQREGYSARAELHCVSHDRMAEFADPETVDCIVFNFGWLPGGDHTIFTRAETSIPAIEAGLALLAPGGVMSLCIYYGGMSGYEEKDALLSYLETLDDKTYTVLLHSFHNRPNNPPIPVFIYKEPRKGNH